MRKIHRKIGLLAAPFLLVSAVTGLLWAYAPHLYLKPAPSAPAPAIDENGRYVPVAEAVGAARILSEGAKVRSVTLRPEAGRLVYVVNLASKKGPAEIWVDAAGGEASLPERTAAWRFHSWVMKLHRLEFFGTKKELVAIPGTALLLLLTTGFFLLQKPSNKI